MKRFFALIVLVLYLVSARPRPYRYTAAFWESFDTVVVITAYSASQRQFDVAFEAAVNSFSETGRYYDRFSYSEEIANVAYINRYANEWEIEMDKRSFSLLRYGKESEERTDGLVDMTFGSVSSIWYDKIKRCSAARLPEEELERAKLYTGIKKLILDEDRKTAKLLERSMMIDVEAFAKGYAIEEAAQIML